MPNSDRSSPLCQFTLWANNENAIWLASSISIFRNVEKYKFPGKLDVERRKQIITILSQELCANPALQEPKLLKAEDLDGYEKEYLVEHFLSNQSFHQAHTGEGFIVDKPGTLLIALNMRNHLHFEWLDIKGELENSWNQLVKIDSALGKAVNYAYSPKYGFLTADPFQCGTALQVTVFLQLAALIHTDKINDILENLIDDSLAVTGLQGSPTEIIGDILALQNQYTLGVTEENILSSLRSVTTKLMVEEHAARSKIRQEMSPILKDKVSRAYGILIHSYQIETVEALNAISLLKLGAEMGWLTGLTNKQFNELFFSCRRAHLLCQSPDKIAQEEIPHRRAEFIHKALKELKLTI
jgi:protein arginine kinase